MLAVASLATTGGWCVEREGCRKMPPTRLGTVICARKLVNQILGLSYNLFDTELVPAVREAGTGPLAHLAHLVHSLDQSADIAETKGERLLAAGIIGNLGHMIGH